MNLEEALAQIDEKYNMGSFERAKKVGSSVTELRD